MIDDLDELRRRAVSTGDVQDWRRLSVASARAGLSADGERLPEGAMFQFDGAGFVHPWGAEQLAFSPCGEFFASVVDTELKLWDFSGSRLLWQGDIPEESSVAFSQRFLMVHSPEDETKTMQRLDFRSGDYQWQDCDALGLEGQVIFDPTGQRLATLSQSGGLRLFSSNDLSLERTIEWHSSNHLLGFAGDGRTIVWQSLGEIGTYNLDNDTKWRGSWPLNVENEQSGFATYGAMIYLHRDAEIWQLDCESWSLECVIHDSRIEQGAVLACSADGQWLVVGQDARLMGWRLSDYSCIWDRVVGVQPTLGSHPQFPLLLVAFIDSTAIQALDFESGEVYQLGRRQAEAVVRLRFVDKSRSVAAGLPIYQSFVLNLDDHSFQFEKRGTLFHAETGQWVLETLDEPIYGAVGGHLSALPTRGPLRGAGFFEGGPAIVSGNKVFAWHQKTWRVCIPWEAPVLQGCFSRDGQWFLCSDIYGTVIAFKDGNLTPVWQNSTAGTPQLVPAWLQARVWVLRHQGRFGSVNKLLASCLDLNTGKSIRHLRFESHTRSSPAWDPPPGLFAATRNGTDIQIWTDRGEELKVLRGHQAKIRALCFSPDGKSLASGDDSGRVVIWKI